MTECAVCGLSFAGTSAFDRHRVGVHAYTFLEGLRFEPPVYDGRRCLDTEAMAEAGMEVDGHGRWRIVASEKQLAGIARMRAGAPTNAQEALPGLGGSSGRAVA